MSQPNVSISVPYNYVAISSAAKMLTELAESFNNSTEEAPEYAQSEPVPTPVTPPPPAAPAVPPPPVESAVPVAEHADAAGIELDADGLPWDERIHANTKTKDVKGRWKYLRGVDKVTLVPQVEAELKAMMREPATEETPPPPAAPETTAAPASQTVTTFAQLITAIQTQHISEENYQAAINKHGIQSLALLGARPDLIPVVAADLGL